MTRSKVPSVIVTVIVAMFLVTGVAYANPYQIFFPNAQSSGPAVLPVPNEIIFPDADCFASQPSTERFYGVLYAACNPRSAADGVPGARAYKLTEAGWQFVISAGEASGDAQLWIDPATSTLYFSWYDTERPSIQHNRAIASRPAP